ncbi:SnoaL-like domain-containing protein [Mucilaginibacter sp. OK098]|uniref:SnoaL-like domain-containing protein n=1 Tax=Mucilaginibacter sp. OK098 TaxID=1855297 RepID=UPI00090F61C8|nr:SnoaL-like domain-containing protein [Mucilaginibacter sp. OK098]SHL90827.1 hypothetical protein SAMN05216524_101143 [Mucilaginibacter sp. OK098]
MTATSISQTLITLLRNQEFLKAYQDLFSEDAESIDPINPTPGPIKGLAKLIELEKQFLAKAKIRAITISEAIHSEAYFSIRLFMQFDINGKESSINELCVYKVNAGKIISQQFFIS